MSPQVIEFLMKIEDDLGIPYDIEPSDSDWPRTAGQIHQQLMRSMNDPRLVVDRIPSDELWDRLVLLIRERLGKPDLEVGLGFDVVAAVSEQQED